jgi:predicted DNA-binding protein (MmcQ/YjbR family)
MKAWSAALADEVRGWPHVSTRPFFGFTALYRGEKMFAALPRTRGWESANSLAFKLGTDASDVSARLEKDPHIRVWSGKMQKARWFTFQLGSDADIHEALDWLGEAYEAAARSKKSR